MSILNCLGYFQDDSADRRLFGFINVIPPKASQLSIPVSLNELLQDVRNPKRTFALPTLPQRIRIAQRLAITFLELHNSEWLHKSFHSDNVIFFKQNDKVVQFEAPYVCGFEFSRPDQVSAISFDVQSSLMDIYRHPSLRGPFQPGKERPRYQRAYDVYSLGLVLLEIGLWQSVRAFQKVD